MRRKATHVYSGLQDPDARISLTLTPLAIEDLTDTPVYSLTPAGLSELATNPEGLTLTGEPFKQCLEEFFLAYQERQKARGHVAVLAAMSVEERTALSLGWAILNELGLL